MLDSASRKEDAVISQYGKLVESLKADVRELERQMHESETRSLTVRQEYQSKIDEGLLKLDFAHEKLSNAQADTLKSQNEVNRLNLEVMQMRSDLKAQEKTHDQLISTIALKA